MKNSKQQIKMRTTSDEDEPINVDTTSQKLQANNILNNLRNVILEGEFSSAEMQAAVRNNYRKL